jgi:tetratricopeptide (TPR) repeat protein
MRTRTRLLVAAAGLALLAAPRVLRADETSSRLDDLEDRALREESHSKYEEALKSFEEAFSVAVKEAGATSDAGRASRDRARAEVYLTRMDDLADHLTAHRRLEEFLRGAKAEDLGPVLKGWVDWERVGYLRRAGMVKESLDLLDSLGFVSKWWVIGPFDNEQGRGFGVKTGPETDAGIAVELSASYPGKERQVSWRRVPAVHPYGWIDLSAMMRPNEQALAYATTWFHCDAPREVTLRFGSDESLAVWVNGTEMVRRDVIRRGGFDQDVVGVTLQKGWNRVFVKVGNTTGSWGFRMRVTDAEGKPVTDLATPGSDDEVQAASAAKEPGGAAVKAGTARGALDALEPAAPKGKSADEGSDDARAYFYLGILHRARQYDDQKEAQTDRKYLDRAAKLRPDNPVYRFMAAEAASRPIDMSVEKEENQQRRGREKAIELDPEYAEAYLALAGYYTYSLPNLARAEEMVRKAISLNDRFLEAHLLLVDVLRRRGFQTEAGVYLDKLLDRAEFKERVQFLRELRRQGEQSGLMTAAADACRKALDVDHENAESRDRLAQVLMHEGLSEDAVGVFDERVRLNPFDIDAYRRKAYFLEGLGRLPDAAATAASGLALAPEDKDLLDLEARVLHRMGKKDDAVARWKEALRVDPKNAVLKRYVEWLDPSLKPFEIPYIEDASALLAEVKGRETANKENDPAIVVLDKGVTRVNPDGTHSSFTQRIVKILNNMGVKQNAYYSAGGFWASDESFEWRTARVWRKDGTVEEAQVQSGSPFVRWPQLQPGDAIEVQHRTDELQQGFFGDYFGDSWSFASREPVVRSEWTLLVPSSRELQVHATHMPAGKDKPETGTLDDGKTRTYTWSLSGLEKIRSEPAMPNPSESYPEVEVTTYKDWSEFGRWWWSLIKKQFVVDDGMREKVAELTKDSKTRLDKVKAIYDFVVTDIQYQAWEFGVHGYKPYTATAIFNRKWGDCKDKAILIKTLLDLVGVEAYPVLIMASQSRSEEDMTLAQVGKFNHCIAFVPDVDGEGHSMFLDGTAQYNSLQNVPTMDRGARVLVVKPEGAEVVQIPWNKPEDFAFNQDFEVALQPNGSADFTGKATFAGDFSVMARGMFSVEGQRKIELSKILGNSLGKHEIQEATFPDLKDISSPTVDVGLKVHVDKLGQVDGSKMTVGARFVQLFPMSMFFAQLASLKEREHDMVLLNPISFTEKATYVVPAGWTVSKLPDSKNVEASFARYTISVEAKDGRIRYERTLQLTKNRIPKEQYAEFRSLVSKVNASLTEKIVLEQTAVPAEVPAPAPAPAPGTPPVEGGKAGGGK